MIGVHADLIGSCRHSLQQPADMCHSACCLCVSLCPTSPARPSQSERPGSGCASSSSLAVSVWP